MKRLKVYKESSINYAVNPVIIECKVIFENMENRNLEGIDYKEKINYDGTSMNISSNTVGSPIFVDKDVKGTLFICGTLNGLKAYEVRTLEYTLIINTIVKGGIFPICSFINVSAEGEKLSTYHYLKIHSEKIIQKITSQRKNSSSGRFRISTSADMHSSESNVIIRGYIPIKDTVTLEITDIIGFNGSNRRTGEIIKPGDRLTDTFIDFERAIKIQKSTNNIFSVDFKLIAVRDLNKNKSICFNLLPPKLGDSDKCYLANVPEVLQEEITLNTNLVAIKD